MKIKRILPALSIILLIILTFTACDNEKKEQGIYGSWAYIHDKETEIAVFKNNGKAKYQGKDYTFTSDDQFIELKDADGKITKMRYLLNDKGMYLYQNSTYTYVDEGKSQNLVGKWLCKETNWSYIFSSGGAFKEDDIFQGRYIVDEENSTFTLIYEGGQLEDTLCYYKLLDNKLEIEYPWQMVPTGSE
ncbi:MAG: hypothetical protein PUC65_09730 [Clostridiales bacterium]|nr:hypothetical protein [Clostridiales bacterium]